MEAIEQGVEDCKASVSEPTSKKSFSDLYEISRKRKEELKVLSSSRNQVKPREESDLIKLLRKNVKQDAKEFLRKNNITERERTR